MAKILVSVTDPAVKTEIVASLTAAGHETQLGKTPNSQDSNAVLDEISRAHAKLIILDYVIDDAVSVKLLQAADDRGILTPFVFIMPEEFTLGQALMAVNEGAGAVIPRPLDSSRLVNYVTRALSGPSRHRHTRADPKSDSKKEELAKLTQELKKLRAHNQNCQRLIAHLLATPIQSQNRRVMVVSDSPYQRDLLKKLLSDYHFTVFTASGAQEGIQVALKEKPLIVVSDLEMEGQNGIEFCHALKIEHKFIPCYFIICTANSSRIDTVTVPGNGVDTCILKPSNTQDARDFISRVAQG
ncbi:MAG: response regulator, partial [Planctomycetota bacterium]|nr:response regulator [Planctomycetota bacterium]